MGTRLLRGEAAPVRHPPVPLPARPVLPLPRAPIGAAGGAAGQRSRGAEEPWGEGAAGRRSRAGRAGPGAAKDRRARRPGRRYPAHRTHLITESVELL